MRSESSAVDDCEFVHYLLTFSFLSETLGNVLRVGISLWRSPIRDRSSGGLFLNLDLLLGQETYASQQDEQGFLE